MKKLVDGLSGSDSNLGIDPRGMPGIPSICFENEDCDRCFDSAMKEFTNMRIYFAQLGLIGAETRTFYKSAVAFGNSVSGIHGVAGIGWQAEKINIDRTYQTFKKNYISKYNELCDRLHTAMLDLNKCETQYGLNDWYNRFGYMFYEFMKAQYAWHD